MNKIKAINGWKADAEDVSAIAILVYDKYFSNSEIYGMPQAQERVDKILKTTESATLAVVSEKWKKDLGAMEGRENFTGWLEAFEPTDEHVIFLLNERDKTAVRYQGCGIDFYTSAGLDEMEIVCN